MEDMSAQLKLNWENGLNAGESMAGGNTTAYDADNHALKGPGSESVYPRPEATDEPDLVPIKVDPHHIQGTHGPTKGEGGWTKFGITKGFGRSE